MLLAPQPEEVYSCGEKGDFIYLFFCYSSSGLFLSQINKAAIHFSILRLCRARSHFISTTHHLPLCCPSERWKQHMGMF